MNLSQQQHDEEPENAKISERKSPEREIFLKNDFPHGKEVVDGDEEKVVKESEELVVHFVSNPDKFEDPAKRNFNWYRKQFQGSRANLTQLLGAYLGAYLGA